VDAAPLVAFASSSADFDCRQVVFSASHGGLVVALDAVTGNEVWSTSLGRNVHIEGGITCQADFRLRVEKRLSGEGDKSDCSSEGIGNKATELLAWPIYVTSYTAQDVDGASAVLPPDSNEDDPHLMNSISSSVGRLWCLDASSGRVLWHSSHHISGEVKGMPALTRIPLANPNPILPTSGCSGYDGLVDRSVDPEYKDAVLVGAHDGCLYVFDAISGHLMGYLQCDVGSLFAAPSVIGSSRDGAQDLLDVCVCSTSGYIKSISVYLSHSKEEGEVVRSNFLSNWSHRSCDNAPIFGTPCLVSLPGSTAPTVCSSPTTRIAADVTSLEVLTPSHKSQPRPQAPAAIAVVYGTVGGALCCISACSGEELWRYPPVTMTVRERDRSPIFSSPVATACHTRTSQATAMSTDASLVACMSTDGGDDDGACSKADGDGLSQSEWVIFGSHDCCVRAVDITTGELAWEVSVGAVVYSTAQIVTIHSNGGRRCVRVIACTTAGDVCVIGSGEGARGWVVLSKVRLKGEIFSSPVFAPTHLQKPLQSSQISGMSSGGSSMLATDGSLVGTVYVGCRDDCLHCIALVTTTKHT
jgi:outer membrane protein assembly factor BamB